MEREVETTLEKALRAEYRRILKAHTLFLEQLESYTKQLVPTHLKELSKKDKLIVSKNLKKARDWLTKIITLLQEEEKV